MRGVPRVRRYMAQAGDKCNRKMMRREACVFDCDFVSQRLSHTAITYLKQTMKIGSDHV